MSGQAESAPSIMGLGDLASFLSDTPEEESTGQEAEETTAEESTADDGDTEDTATDEQEDGEEDSPEEAEKPAPVAKYAVTVKAEDGTETTEEVPVEELVKGYQRQSDYTRKTQALAQRETEAVEFLKSKHDEIRTQYLQQAEAARAAVAQMAGLKTEAELEQLATTDPAAWVAETQRQRQINAFLSGLDNQLATERQKAEVEAQQRQQKQLQDQFTRTWAELEKEKIDKPALAKIFGDVTKTYGFTDKELSSVYDHRLVKMMRDAAAYQALKAQKPQVTQKVTNAPKLPAKTAPAAEVRQQKALSQKFNSGRAKLSDLAAFLR